MNNTRTRRYIFIDYEDLQKVKFKKLEKVCDKVFIIINADEDMIPLQLVIQMQGLGKGVKWIPVFESDEGNNNTLMGFLMGKMHQKANKDVEFAILSNDDTFDPLVNFINADGRSCLRVKRKKTQDEKENEEEVMTKNEDSLTASTDFTLNPFLNEAVLNENTIQTTARDTKERLQRSFDRPGNLQKLRHFILLNNQELMETGNVDKVVKQLQESDDIILTKGEVTYNF